jgi:Adenylosuccinate synthetase
MIDSSPAQDKRLHALEPDKAGRAVQARDHQARHRLYAQRPGGPWSLLRSACLHCSSLPTPGSIAWLSNTSEIKCRTGGVLQSFSSKLAFGLQALPSVPADLKTLQEVEVEYEEMPGWQQDISGARSWDELPVNAKSYIRC